MLDRSGSMRGNKLASVKEAAKQIVSGLNPGERFNIITYNEGVNLFEAAPVEKNGASEKAAHAWLDAVVARGGTNMHEALAAALSQPSHEGMLPVVLFLTDGLPTIGRTSEKSIAALAGEGNRAERRIFTIGVGEDVNAPC
ncbi:VWA domain-containing protein [Akkermansia massiliensis]